MSGTTYRRRVRVIDVLALSLGFLDEDPEVSQEAADALRGLSGEDSGKLALRLHRRAQAGCNTGLTSLALTLISQAGT